MNPPARVIVIDDDASFRASTERFLRCVGYEVETYPSPVQLFERPRREAPACVLLDLRMPGMNGLEAQEALALHGHDYPVVFMTAHADVASGIQAMKHGAVDFLSKTADEDQILDAIERSLARDRANQAACAARRNARDRLARLTGRERQVCDHLMTGLLNKQIAAELGIAESTVKVHRSRMMQKLRVDSVVALMRLLDQAADTPAAGVTRPYDDDRADGLVTA